MGTSLSKSARVGKAEVRAKRQLRLTNSGGAALPRRPNFSVSLVQLTLRIYLQILVDGLLIEPDDVSMNQDQQQDESKLKAVAAGMRFMLAMGSLSTLFQKFLKLALIALVLAFPPVYLAFKPNEYTPLVQVLLSVFLFYWLIGWETAPKPKKLRNEQMIVGCPKLKA